MFHASITGQSVIGGIFGSLDDTQIQFTPASQLYMDNESLEASSGICGTLAGALSYQEPGKEILLNPEILVINPNIKIKGGNNVGGIIGTLYNGTLTGTYTPEFNAANVIVSKIPRPIFPGNINSENPIEKMPLLLEELSDMPINLPSEDSSRNFPFTAEVQSEESSDMRAILKYQIVA